MLILTSTKNPCIGDHKAATPILVDTGANTSVASLDFLRRTLLQNSPFHPDHTVSVDEIWFERGDSVMNELHRSAYTGPWSHSGKLQDLGGTDGPDTHEPLTDAHQATQERRLLTTAPYDGSLRRKRDGIA